MQAGVSIEPACGDYVVRNTELAKMRSPLILFFISVSAERGFEPLPVVENKELKASALSAIRSKALIETRVEHAGIGSLPACHTLQPNRREPSGTDRP